MSIEDMNLFIKTLRTAMANSHQVYIKKILSSVTRDELLEITSYLRRLKLN